MQQHESYKLRNPDKIRIIKSRYRDKHRERLNKDARERYHANIQKSRDHSRTTREKIRDEIFAILGRVCKTCGFSDIRALQFDHIKGGGREDLRQEYRETRIRHMRDNPEETKLKYQVLCANCNVIKRHFRGENCKPKRYSL